MSCPPEKERHIMEFDRDLFLPVSLADMQRRGWGA